MNSEKVRHICMNCVWGQSKHYRNSTNNLRYCLRHAPVYSETRPQDPNGAEFPCVGNYSGCGDWEGVE